MTQLASRERITFLAKKIKRGFKIELSSSRKILHALNVRHAKSLLKVRAQYQIYQEEKRKTDLQAVAIDVLIKEAPVSDGVDIDSETRQDSLQCIQSQELQLVSEATQLMSSESDMNAKDTSDETHHESVEASQLSDICSVQCGSSSPVRSASLHHEDSMISCLLPASFKENLVDLVDSTGDQAVNLDQALTDKPDYAYTNIPMKESMIKQRSMFEDSGSSSDQDSSIENISAFLRDDLDPLSLIRQ